MNFKSEGKIKNPSFKVGLILEGIFTLVHPQRNVLNHFVFKISLGFHTFFLRMETKVKMLSKIKPPVIATA